ncbi:MAG: carbohydrate-binding domain-containing protein [Candidatus Woesearchaeota archaeon]
MEDDSLYNAIIVALVIGIAVVIVTLVVARPPEEYFTELYYTNHTLLQKYIHTNTTYWYSVTIASHENSTFYYYALVSSKVYLKNSTYTVEDYFMNISLEPGLVQELDIPYSLADFVKAQVKFEILNKGQEIHFWVYNRDLVFEYPDTVASIDCLKSLSVVPGNVTIRARGAYVPNMKLRLDGVEVLSTVVNNSDYADYTVQAQGFTLLDIVFDNDWSNSTANQDRNLYIQHVKVGNATLKPNQAVADLGTGGKAFDCENLKTVDEGLYWNAALRFRVGE